MAEVLFRARLTRENSSVPWGFRLQGGADFGRPLTLLKVVEDSVACKGGLKATDILVKLAGYPADDMTHKDAQDVIIAAGDSLEIIVERAEEEVISPPSSEDDETDELENQVEEEKKPQNDVKEASKDVKTSRQPVPQVKAKVSVSPKLSPALVKKSPGSPKLQAGRGASPKSSPTLRPKQAGVAAASGGKKAQPSAALTTTSLDKTPTDHAKPAAAAAKTSDRTASRGPEPKSVNEQTSVSNHAASRTEGVVADIVANGLPATGVHAPAEKVVSASRSVDSTNLPSESRTISAQKHSLEKDRVSVQDDRHVQDNTPSSQYQVASKDSVTASDIPSSQVQSDQWTASGTTVTVAAPPVDSMPTAPSATMVSQPMVSKPPPPYIPAHTEPPSLGTSEPVSSSSFTIHHAPPPSYDESIAANQGNAAIHAHHPAVQPEPSMNHQEQQEVGDTVGQLSERMSPSRRRRTTSATVSSGSPEASAELQSSRQPDTDSLYPWRRQKLPETVRTGESLAGETQPPGEETVSQSIKPSLKLVGKRIEMVQSPTSSVVSSQTTVTTQQAFIGQDGYPVVVSTAVPQIYVGADGQRVAISTTTHPQVYVGSDGQPFSISSVPAVGPHQMFHILPVDHRGHPRMGRAHGRRRMSVPDIRSYSRGNDIYHPPQPSDIYFSTADPDLVDIPMPAVKEMVEDLNRRLEVIAAQHPRLAEPTEFGTSYLPKDTGKSEETGRSERGGAPISPNDFEALKRRIFGTESTAEIKDAYQKIFDIKSPLSSPPPRRKVFSMNEDLLSKQQGSRRVHFAEPVEASVVEIPRTTRRERRERRREREIEKEASNAQAPTVNTTTARTVPAVPSAAFVTGSGAERYHLGDHVEVGQDRILVPTNVAGGGEPTSLPSSMPETVTSQPAPFAGQKQTSSLSYVVPIQVPPQTAVPVAPTQVVTPIPSQAAQPPSHVAASHVTPPAGHVITPSGHVTPPVLKMTPPPATHVAPPTTHVTPSAGYVPPPGSLVSIPSSPMVSTKAGGAVGPSVSPVPGPGSGISVSITRQGQGHPTVFTLPQAAPGQPTHFHYTISGRKSTDPMSIQYSYPPTYEESQRIRRGRQRQRSFDDSMLLDRRSYLQKSEPQFTYSNTLQPGQVYGRVSPSYATPLSPLDTMQSRTLRAMETQAYERSPTGMLSPAYSISSVMGLRPDTIQSKSFKALEAHLLPVEGQIRQPAPGEPPLRVEVLGIPRQASHWSEDSTTQPVLQPAAVVRPFVPGAREDYLSPLPSPVRSPSPMAPSGSPVGMYANQQQVSGAPSHTPLVPGVFAIFDEAFTEKFLQWQNQGRRSHFQSETYKLVHELDENERKYGGTQ